MSIPTFCTAPILVTERIGYINAISAGNPK